ncbi:MAG TPA: sodium/proton-translocating pyrophosphatase, partial [Victivallales bacterium]|nr:sodium/proton-translocating pyrophosphatase [Victivallales bacterium]
VTSTAQRELLGPGILAVTTPILTAFLLGSTLFGTSGLVEVEINGQIESAPLAGAALGAYLAGAILVGQLMAVFMSNAGGAWDNAKKHIEKGNFGGKKLADGSKNPVHAAAVIGDTVGDPCKDTSGPSLNILIKLMSMVSIVFTPVVIKFSPMIKGAIVELLVK